MDSITGSNSQGIMPSFWELAKYKSNDTKSLRFYFSFDSAASWPSSLPPRFAFNSEIFRQNLAQPKQEIGG